MDLFVKYLKIQKLLPKILLLHLSKKGENKFDLIDFHKTFLNEEFMNFVNKSLEKKIDPGEQKEKSMKINVI